MNMKLMRDGTWKFPWIVFVEVDFRDDDGRGEAMGDDLLAEVVDDELLVGRVEAKARWEVEIALGVYASPSHGLVWFGLVVLCFDDDLVGPLMYIYIFWFSGRAALAWWAQLLGL